MFNWSIDDYGPLEIPKKGMVIKLNQRNYILYNKILNIHENVRVSSDKKSWYIDGKAADYYTFKSDYFFVLGDNRNNAADSRYYGFIPESYVIGKAVRILFSANEKKIEWGRFMRSLN